jgi:hypothetical protein
MIRTIILLVFMCPFSLLSQIIYVDIDALGNNDGSSWENAYNDLAEALDNAQYGDSIWVAVGTYFPTADDNRHKHFTLKNGVRLFGGFVGTETQIAQRDWELYPTIMDGNIGDSEEATDNSYTVLYINVADSTTLVDGFTIRNGYADGVDSLATMCGGGVFLQAHFGVETLPIVKSCKIEYCYAEKIGGGLYIGAGIEGSFIAPKVLECIISENNAGTDGGGMCIGGYPKTRRVELINSVFNNNHVKAGNTLDPDGVALYITPTPWSVLDSTKQYLIKGCTFLQNDAGEANAGTITFESGNGKFSLVIDSCLFNENQVPEGEGSAFEFQQFGSDTTSSIIIRNTVFEDNYGGSRTVSIDAPRHDLLIENCRFSRNETDDGGSSLEVSGNTKIINCLFENNFQSSGSPGFCLGSGHPLDTTLLVNCTFVGNESYNPYFCFVINNFDEISGPMIVQNCIFQGSKFEPFNGGYFQYYFGAKPFVDNSIFDADLCNNPFDTFLTCGPNVLVDLPIFIDSTAGDFRLAPCSPGVNMGYNEAWPDYLLDTDLMGEARIQENIIDIGAYELPALALEIDSTTGFVCHGDTIGSIAFVAPLSACAPYSITVPDGSISQDLFYGPLSQGSYTYILEDALGRSDTTTVVFTEPDALSVTAQITDATNSQSNDGSIEITGINGGVPPYELIWSHGQTEPLITDLEPALYALTLIDSLGCELVEYFLVGVVNSVEEEERAVSYLLHPNPATHQINLVTSGFPGGEYSLMIYDLQGRTVYTEQGNRSAGEQHWQLRNMEDWPEGLYLLQLQTEQDAKTLKFLKR